MGVTTSAAPAAGQRRRAISWSLTPTTRSDRPAPKRARCCRRAALGLSRVVVSPVNPYLQRPRRQRQSDAEDRRSGVAPRVWTRGTVVLAGDRLIAIPQLGSHVFEPDAALDRATSIVQPQVIGQVRCRVRGIH